MALNNYFFQIPLKMKGVLYFFFNYQTMMGKKKICAMPVHFLL